LAFIRVRNFQETKPPEIVSSQKSGGMKTYLVCIGNWNSRYWAKTCCGNSNSRNKPRNIEKIPEILENSLSNSRKYRLFGRIIFLELPNARRKLINPEFRLILIKEEVLM